jgi:hypothetical protein
MPTKQQLFSIQHYLQKGYISYEIPNIDNILIEDSNSEYFNQFFIINSECQAYSRDEAFDLKREFFKHYLRHIGKKHPQITKTLINNIDETHSYFKNFSVQELERFFHNVIEHKFLFTDYFKEENQKIDVTIKNFQESTTIPSTFVEKGISFQINSKEDKESVINNLKKSKKRKNIIHFLKTNDTERVDDLITQLKNNHEYNLVLKNELTMTNKKLWTNDTYLLLKNMINIGFTAQDFHDQFGYKISKYKTSDDLFDGLKKFKESLQGWSKDNYLDKFNNINVLYKEIKPNILLVDIDDFEQSKALGSVNWCISTEKHYFNTYVESYNLFRRQVFIYDFNRSVDDPLSMVGITINIKNMATHAHDKQDINILNNSLIDDYLSYTQQSPDDMYHRIKHYFSKKMSKDANNSFSFTNSNYKELHQSMQLINKYCGKDYSDQFLNNFIEQSDLIHRLDYYFVTEGINSKEGNKLRAKIIKNINNSDNPKVSYMECFSALYDGKKRSFEYLLNFFDELSDNCYSHNLLSQYLIKHYSNKHIDLHQSHYKDGQETEVIREMLFAINNSDDANRNRRISIHSKILPFIIKNDFNSLYSIMENKDDGFDTHINEEVFRHIGRYNEHHKYLDNPDVRKHLLTDKNFFKYVSTHTYIDDKHQKNIINHYMPKEYFTETIIDVFKTSQSLNFTNFPPEHIDWNVVFDEVRPIKPRLISNLIQFISENPLWNDNNLRKLLKKELKKDEYVGKTIGYNDTINQSIKDFLNHETVKSKLKP